MKSAEELAKALWTCTDVDFVELVKRIQSEAAADIRERCRSVAIQHSARVEKSR